ncbi:MAG TPA: TonB-dependent receptor, partial [Thermoanaerobaculia bacterium]|nr:TonB-dependent receptor [Thermoanaerobaculia bacterium]
MTKAVARLSGVVLSILLPAGVLSAQTTGSIRGVVQTGGTALPGVTVEAKSPNLQGSRVTVSDSQGRYNLTLLPPGRYTITATLEGFSGKAQIVPLSLGESATLNLELVQTKTESVTVTAEAGTVATDSSSSGRNIDSKVFQALPTGRNYASVAQLDAGVGTDGSDTRNQSITVYGSTGLENTYMVDGANTTGVEFGSQGKTLNFEFIQEVEFKSGGYEAEFAGSTGGLLNVVTKSGGNEFHGDGFGYFNNASLQASSKHTESQTPDGIPLGFSNEDYGADIGGFILKDSLWFFGAYDRVTNSLN